jgi:hypothetical protein
MGSSPAARISVATALAVAVLATSGPLRAQSGQSPDDGLRTPPRAFALPIEIEHDFGADNGEATIIRLLPLYSFPLTEQLRLVNVDIVTLADAPGGVPGRPETPIR